MTSIERQPSREDILMSWFLGEAQELADQLNNQLAAYAEIKDQLDAASLKFTTLLDTATVDVLSAQKEAVTAHRHLVEHGKESMKRATAMLATADRHYQDHAQSMLSKVLPLAVLASFIGAVLGTGVVLAVAKYVL